MLLKYPNKYTMVRLNPPFIKFLFPLIFSFFSASSNAQIFDGRIQHYSLFSPDSTIKLSLYLQNEQLLYTVSSNNSAVIEPSLMGLIINKAFKSKISSLELKSTATINTITPSRGVHSIAINYCKESYVEAKRHRK